MKEADRIEYHFESNLHCALSATAGKVDKRLDQGTNFSRLCPLAGIDASAFLYMARAAAAVASSGESANGLFSRTSAVMSKNRPSP